MRTDDCGGIRRGSRREVVIRGRKDVVKKEEERKWEEGCR